MKQTRGRRLKLWTSVQIKNRGHKLRSKVNVQRVWTQ